MIRVWLRSIVWFVVRCHVDLSTSFLFTTAWKRIVLDEGHVIKNDKCSRLFSLPFRTLVNKSIMALPAEIHWVLSGTPLQNTIDDLFALFRFLRFSPWNSVSPFSLIDRSATCGTFFFLATQRRKNQSRRTRATTYTSIPKSTRQRICNVFEFVFHSSFILVPTQFNHVTSNLSIT